MPSPSIAHRILQPHPTPSSPCRSVRPMSPPPPSTLEDVLDHYTIRSTLFSLLDPLSLIRLQRCSRKLHSHAPEMHKTQWNLPRFLTRWVRDPAAFRRQMAANDAILAGSAALQFFDRTHYPDSDLDVLFTGAGNNGPEATKCYAKLASVAAHLVAAEGYTPHAPPGIDWARATGKELFGSLARRRRRDSPAAHREISGTYPLLFDVFEFRKGPRRVQLVMYERSALESVLTAHSTVVMNFVGWDCAYSLFPAYTFGSRQSLVNRVPDAGTAKVMSKWRGRGFAFGWKKVVGDGLGPENDAEFQAPTMDPFRRVRSLADRHCWRLELDTAGLEDVSAQTVSRDMVFGTVCDYFSGRDPFGYPGACVSFRFFRYDSPVERPEGVAGVVGGGV
ncbi:uncharacterized protein H6S33_007121 [Morchella sextelata]|uniref:uncharacterized protein n=1 Tax=Morchella sextelata TaxID=1174677 RepID=UPI001D0467DE|nr:uncharacterized protein H6S33_007121 [Morchella sextelata]KAH0604090.1 hypothetical protein H6S33_007121 [Morchella sextelata]